MKDVISSILVNIPHYQHTTIKQYNTAGAGMGDGVDTVGVAVTIIPVILSAVLGDYMQS